MPGVSDCQWSVRFSTDLGPRDSPLLCLRDQLSCRVRSERTGEISDLTHPQALLQKVLVTGVQSQIGQVFLRWRTASIQGRGKSAFRHIVYLQKSLACGIPSRSPPIDGLLYGATTTSAPPPMRSLSGTLRRYPSRRIGRESRRSHATVPERNLVGTGELAYHTASTKIKKTPDGGMTRAHAHPRGHWQK